MGVGVEVAGRAVKEVQIVVRGEQRVDGIKLV